MKNYSAFGDKIKIYREKKAENITQTAKSLDLHRSYLSKLENGHFQPSTGLIDKLADYYNLDKQQISDLYFSAGYGKKGEIMQLQNREGVNRMENSQILGTQDKDQAVEVNVQSNTPILYSDAIFVTSSDYGVVLDFGQRLGSTKRHNIISRIGMSFEHAEAMLRVIKQNIEDHKMKKVKKFVA